MLVHFSIDGRTSTVSVDDDLENPRDIVEQARTKLVELDEGLIATPCFMTWLCEGVLNSMADDRGDILLGEFSELSSAN